MYKIARHLAWLSIWRRKTRSLMVIMMIALSLTGLLGLQGLYDGMILHLINTTIRSDSGEISLYNKKYRLNKTLDYRLTPISNYIEAFSKIEAIEAYSVRLEKEGLIATAHKSLGAVLKGISLKNEQNFGGLDAFITQGEYSFGENAQKALIGAALAKKLNLKIGSRVIFTAQDATGEINAISFRISGILKTGNPTIDDHAVLVSMEKMSTFLNVQQSATQIALRVKDAERISTAQKELQKRFPTIDVLRWDELYPLLIQMQEWMNIFNLASYAIVFVVAALGIFGVMLVSVLERMREFSIMLAIGTPYRTVRNQIIMEASFLGLIGYIAGALGGWIFLLYMSTSGVDMRAFEAGLELYGYSAVMYANMHLYYFFQAFFAVLFATLLSVIWPLRKLKKIKPIQVIQGKML
ncbi:ABC transporter permease [Sulfurovum sp. XGS-02]|uniref:ABC transporter permease n=1 Tax=Sulfurovum sp. XGS-02 TaxID=2925411 RepID=UPI00204500D2|nr:FtsX-like permease family protein [Sulfurovum sp. XGS-02]UPT78425.1 ABC transporter permease [Sulfurovum sp. XGS-02]